MSDWSIGNFFKSISTKQFTTPVNEFRQAVEQSLGVPCNLAIDVMNGIGQSTFLKTADPSDVTKAVWDKATCIEVNVAPADPAKTAGAQIHFKGVDATKATFSFAADEGDKVRDAMAAEHRVLWFDDGYNSNLRERPDLVAKIGPLILVR